MEDKNNCYLDETYILKNPPPPISTIYIGKDTGAQIGVDKKFNWFQKKMIKWCFGFDVKENNNERK
jgi:hypothetical protein